MMIGLMCTGQTCLAGKNKETFYGYKNHAKIDAKSKFINSFAVTDASVHDLQALDDLEI